MRKLNNVKQLGRTNTHRNAMLSNMVTSLFKHERIITTKQKAKVLKRVSEKMITRAKRNLALDDTQVNKRVHNKRIVMKSIKDRDVVAKLFDDIAVRSKERNGGYTRIYLLGKRPGDAAEKAIIELVDKKEVSVASTDAKEKKSKKEKK
jgi:large subunit ribosomal protein L17